MTITYAASGIGYYDVFYDTRSGEAVPQGQPSLPALESNDQNKPQAQQAQLDDPNAPRTPPAQPTRNSGVPSFNPSYSMPFGNADVFGDWHALYYSGQLQQPYQEQYQQQQQQPQEQQEPQEPQDQQQQLENLPVVESPKA
jgi:hypothetical protein